MRYVFAGLGTLLLTLAPLSAEEVVFALNYDVELSDGASVQSRARVRSGSVVPIEAGNHRLDMHVAEADGNTVRVAIMLFKRSRGVWHAVATDDIAFEIKLSSPAEFAWSSDEHNIGFDLAMIIGRDRHRDNSR